MKTKNEHSTDRALPSTPGCGEPVFLVKGDEKPSQYRVGLAPMRSENKQAVGYPGEDNGKRWDRGRPWFSMPRSDRRECPSSTHAKMTARINRRVQIGAGKLHRN